MALVIMLTPMMTEMALPMPQTPFHLILQKRWTLMLTALVTTLTPMMTATVLRMARMTIL